MTTALPKGRFRVQLVNGHELVARVLKRDLGRLAGIGTGDELDLRVSPGDMSQGVIEDILKSNKE